MLRDSYLVEPAMVENVGERANPQYLTEDINKPRSVTPKQALEQNSGLARWTSAVTRELAAFRKHQVFDKTNWEELKSKYPGVKPIPGSMILTEKPGFGKRDEFGYGTVAKARV
eukprot:5836785-Amphidinium_carterae.1